MEGNQDTPGPDNLNNRLNEISMSPERQRKRVDYLIVCGQGPVQTKKEKEKASSVSGAEPSGADANSWMKFIAYAAGEIHERGLAGKLILTGGKTGGEGFPSEADLMKRIIQEKYNIPDGDIIIEDKAGNTLQNFALSINKIDSEKQLNNPSLGVLGADYHAERIFLLSALFNLPVSEVYSAEETLLHTWSRDLSEGSRKFLVARTDPGESERLGLFDPQLNSIGEEAKPVGKRANEERRYAAGLVEIPQYWIGYVGLLESDERIKIILNNIDKEQLKALDISPDEDIQTIRKNLEPFRSMTDQGGKRVVPYPEIADTGDVQQELMKKIRVIIPPNLPVLQSVYHEHE